MQPPETGAIELPFATLWIDDGGILCTISNNNKRTIEGMKTVMDVYKNLTKGKGGEKFCLLSDITNVGPINRETRIYLGRELPKYIKAAASISQSPMGRMLANVFLGLGTTTFPAKVFSNEKNAREWLMQFNN